MRILAALLAGFITLGAGPPPRVSIRTSAGVISVGREVRVTCTVPHDDANRFLFVAVDSYLSSTYQIDAEHEPTRITWDVWFAHIPCEVYRAVCIVNTVGKKDAMASLPLTVVGCEP